MIARPRGTPRTRRGSGLGDTARCGSRDALPVAPAPPRTHAQPARAPGTAARTRSGPPLAHLRPARWERCSDQQCGVPRPHGPPGRAPSCASRTQSGTPLARRTRQAASGAARWKWFHSPVRWPEAARGAAGQALRFTSSMRNLFPQDLVLREQGRTEAQSSNVSVVANRSTKLRQGSCESKHKPARRRRVCGPGKAGQRRPAVPPPAEARTRS